MSRNSIRTNLKNRLTNRLLEALRRNGGDAGSPLPSPYVVAAAVGIGAVVCAVCGGNSCNAEPEPELVGMVAVCRVAACRVSGDRLSNAFVIIGEVDIRTSLSTLFPAATAEAETSKPTFVRPSYASDMENAAIVSLSIPPEAASLAESFGSLGRGGRIFSARSAPSSSCLA